MTDANNVLFMGVDASTQAVKASLLDADLSVKSEVEVRFDRDLPQYGTSGGTLLGPSGSGIVYSPVMLVVQAMDLLFDRVKAAQWPVDRIRGVSAAGQQHASVYWSHDAPQLLSNIRAADTMATQLRNAFSRDEIPNWQDSSTIAECAAMEKHMGGAQHLARMTGSKAHTRFTASQIMRFKSQDPKAYQATSRISLVSSFITTLLCLDGEIKGIDESDACGMNLWDMQSPQRGWVSALLEFIGGSPEGAQDLAGKLGKVESDGGRVVGHIGKWFVDRYGFSPECIVCPGTGDNPATFLSFTLRENEGLVSLGTSDTVLVSTSAYRPDPDFHAFFHPAQIVHPSIADGNEEQDDKQNTQTPMRYFNMLVYKNGSLAREHVRDEYFQGSWEKFNHAVETSRPKGSDALPSSTAFWWLKPDIIPSNASGVFKYITEPPSVDPAHAKKVNEFPDKNTNGIAMLESQMLNYRSRSTAILEQPQNAMTSSAPQLSRIYATGGAAANPTICSVMADVLGCNVCKPVVFDMQSQRWRNANWNACSVAAAYKAAWGWTRRQVERKRYLSFDEFIKQAAEIRRERRLAQLSANGDNDSLLLEEGVAVVAQPDSERASVYTKRVSWWADLERKALQESKRM